MPKQVARHGRASLCLVAFLGGLRATAAEVDVSQLPPPATNRVSFARDIKPILESSCLRCHGAEKPRSEFRLDNRADAIKGGDQGMDILPGNSARSPLIHYTAYLVEDMEMPPVGKGQQLTADQVSLLRAWIDQGAIWDEGAPTNNRAFTLSPIFGGTTVSGDSHKFSEQTWQEKGFNGGADQFEYFEQTSPDTHQLLTGHALLNDYNIAFAVDRNDLGFVHTGWEQYRKYSDDTGGYYPALLQPAPTLREDLHLDIGRAWLDLGLTLPHWPRLVLGYEYDYKQGNEAITSWSAVGTNALASRAIAPASKHLDETVHIIKFDLDDDLKGVTIADCFRGEFYRLNTSYTNVAYNQLSQSVNDGTTYFQGANTLRLEREFSDWFFGSAGYLYSRLNADSTFNLDAITQLQQADIPRITLERESDVGNLNGLIGPFTGLLISTGAQAEWTREQGYGAGTYDQEIPPPPFTLFTVPFNLASDYVETSIQENVGLRYSTIPFTALFAEGRFDRQTTGQDDQFSASPDILNKAVFRTAHRLLEPVEQRPGRFQHVPLAKRLPHHPLPPLRK